MSMGRTLKRVPLDFSWPRGEVWIGYVNQHFDNCSDCKACAGSGLSPEAKRISDQWYGKAPFDPAAYGATPLTPEHESIVAFARRQCAQRPDYYGAGELAELREALRLFDLFRGQWCHHLIQSDVDALVTAERMWDFTRMPRTDEQRETVKQKIAAGGNCWLPESNGYTPTADEVNAWSIGGFGHDAINAGVCLEARCGRDGVTLACQACSGSGDIWSSPEAKFACDDWKPTEPPTGEGFQLWETTSEGSPGSPVFTTIEELCAWCADHATTFGSEKTTAVRWREMLDADFVHHTSGHMVFM